MARCLAEDRSGSNGHRARTAADLGAGAPTVPAERFVRSGALAGHWRSSPQLWGALLAGRSIASEAAAVVAKAIEALPAPQRTVIELRDVHGWRSTDVCECLEIDAATQRTLLHRGRSKIRMALDEHFDPVPHPVSDAPTSAGTVA